MSRYNKFTQFNKVNTSAVQNIMKGTSQYQRENLFGVARMEKALSQFNKVNTSAVQNMMKGISQYQRENLFGVARMEKALSQFNKVNTSAVQNIMKGTSQYQRENLFGVARMVKDFPDLDKIKSITDSLSVFMDDTVVDWEKVELTEENFQEANDIFQSEKPDEKLSQEISQTAGNKGSVKAVIVFIYKFILILEALVNLAGFTQDTLIPITQTLTEYVEEGFFASDKEAVNWVNDKLKKDAYRNITNNFRIVTKEGLIVREGKKVDSKINGKLNSADVVQIVEKRKNWIFIFYSNHDESEVVQGWVFTRYLKQIK